MDQLGKCVEDCPGAEPRRPNARRIGTGDLVATCRRSCPIVKLIGTIESGLGLATAKAEWMRVIQVHPQLSPVPAKEGVSSFSRKPHLYRPDPTTAQVIIDGHQVGSIHWAMDDSRRLVVWSSAGAEEDVRSVATDVASRLSWHLRSRQRYR